MLLLLVLVVFKDLTVFVRFQKLFLVVVVVKDERTWTVVTVAVFFGQVS